MEKRWLVVVLCWIKWLFIREGIRVEYRAIVDQNRRDVAGNLMVKMKLGRLFKLRRGGGGMTCS